MKWNETASASIQNKLSLMLPTTLWQFEFELHDRRDIKILISKTFKRKENWFKNSESGAQTKNGAILEQIW